MKPVSQPTWGGRFAGGPAAAVQQFTESISFDWRLYRHDIDGSIAHARGLARARLITNAEAARIATGLRAIRRQIEAGRFAWDMSAEDVHMNIEAALVRRIGALGKKLHTARSRNDQVATDLRLWLMEAIDAGCAQVTGLQAALVALAKKQSATVIPGYTHLQRAQPVPLAHHLLAYVEMFARDRDRLADARRRTDVCPLGSAALAGSTLKLDREFVARQLGFTQVTQNSMDAVSDRDFVVEFHAAAALLGVHLSRLAEDLILWSSAEYGFITIADAYTTGSSLMPQKKNPDIAELTRGKSARLLGNLVQSLTLLKGLPMTYNRDLQEDKQPLFDSVDTLQQTLPVLAAMLRHVRVNDAVCRAAAADPLLLATDLVDYLVAKGTPFREAHHQVGALVARAEQTATPLPAVVREALGPSAARVFDLPRALAGRKAVGAPSPANIQSQLKRWRRSLSH